MKCKNILLLTLAFIIIFSCSEEYKMKKSFKEAYTGIMKDDDSYELVSFEVFQNSMQKIARHEWFIENYQELKNKSITEEVLDSINEVEERDNPKYWYTGVLVKIRGKNSYGAKVLSEHIAYYSLGRLIEIDGNLVRDNEIMRDFKSD